MRGVTIARRSTSSSHPQASRFGKGRARTAALGQNHGCPPEKDPDGLPPLSSGYPCRTAYPTKDIGMNERKAVCIERCTYRLVGGRWNRAVNVPRQRPTQHRKWKGPQGETLDGTNNACERAIGWWIKERYRSMRGYKVPEHAVGVSRLLAWCEAVAVSFTLPYRLNIN